MDLKTKIRTMTRQEVDALVLEQSRTMESMNTEIVALKRENKRLNEEIEGFCRESFRIARIKACSR